LRINNNVNGVKRDAVSSEPHLAAITAKVRTFEHPPLHPPVIPLSCAVPPILGRCVAITGPGKILFAPGGFSGEFNWYPYSYSESGATVSGSMLLQHRAVALHRQLGFMEDHLCVANSDEALSTMS